MNLRGDLSALDSHELERQLESLFSERAVILDGMSNIETVGNKALYQSGFGMPFGRGPFHARIVYTIQGFLYGGSHRKGLGRLHVIDCEIKDILDECRRRLKTGG